VLQPGGFERGHRDVPGRVPPTVQLAADASTAAFDCDKSGGTAITYREAMTMTEPADLSAQLNAIGAN